MTKRRWRELNNDDMEIISPIYEPLSKKPCIRIWRCVFCQFDNNDNDAICIMCNQLNNRTSIVNTNNLPLSTWSCDWCPFKNTNDNTNCRMCGVSRHNTSSDRKRNTPKPSPKNSASSTNTSDITSCTQSQWECAYCTYLNHYLLTECEVCHIAKSTNNNNNNHLQLTTNIEDRNNPYTVTRDNNNSNSNNTMDDDKMDLAKQELLRFGHRSFRPSQSPVIKDLLNGDNTLLILPTGGGKSLCFQIPILVLNKLCSKQQCNNHRDDIQKGIAIIISPLISLMNDQIHKLKSIGIDAEYINSSLKKSERRDIQNRLKKNEIEMLYCAPELLTTKNCTIIDILNNHRIVTMFVIDEAHCISEWGHSFRSSFRRLSHIREALNEPLTMACTATATQRVRDDILNQLNLNRNNCKVHIGSFDRPNIYLKTIKTHTSNAEHLERIIFQEIKSYQQRKRGDYRDPVIIYCGTTKDTDKTAEYLNKNISLLNKNGYLDVLDNKVGAYHGKMSVAQRKDVQHKFIKGELNIIAATNAFGMGIDKDNVGLVIHKMCPMSVESYYQQIGRAGRNGEESAAVIISDKRKYFLARFSQYTVNCENPEDNVIQKVADIICNEFPLNQHKTCVKKKIREQTGFDEWNDCVTDSTVAAAIKILEKYRVLQRINFNALPINIQFLRNDNSAGRMHRNSNQYKLWQELISRRNDRNEIDIKQFEMTRKLGISAKELTASLTRLKSNKLILYSSLKGSGAIKLFTREWREMIDWDEVRRNRKEAKKNEEKMRELMNTRSCKRKMLLKYFGETYVVGSNRRCCDKCNPYNL